MVDALRTGAVEVVYIYPGFRYWEDRGGYNACMQGLGVGKSGLGHYFGITSLKQQPSRRGLWKSRRWCEYRHFKC